MRISGIYCTIHCFESGSHRSDFIISCRAIWFNPIWFMWKIISLRRKPCNMAAMHITLQTDHLKGPVDEPPHSHRSFSEGSAGLCGPIWPALYLHSACGDLSWAGPHEVGRRYYGLFRFGPAQYPRGLVDWGGGSPFDFLILAAFLPGASSLNIQSWIKLHYHCKIISNRGSAESASKQTCPSCSIQTEAKTFT